MMKRTGFAFVTVLLLASLCSPAQSQVRRRSRPHATQKPGGRAVTGPESGSFANSVYKNDFFGFRVRVPVGWTVSGSARTKFFATKGFEIIGPKQSEEVRGELKEAMKSISYLLVASKYPPGPHRGTAMLTVFALKLDEAEANITGASYLAYTQQSAGALQPPMEVAESVHMKNINGADFAVLGLSVKYPQRSVQQRIHAIVKRNYVLVFSIMYMDEAERPELEAVTNTIEFK